MATPRGATTRGGREGAAALGRRRGRGDGGSCQSGVVNEDDDAEEGNRLDGRRRHSVGGAVRRSSLHLPPRVVAPGVQRWGVGTPRKSRGSGKGRARLPCVRGLPNDARVQLPRGVAAQEKRWFRRGLGFPKGPLRRFNSVCGVLGGGVRGSCSRAPASSSHALEAGGYYTPYICDASENVRARKKNRTRRKKISVARAWKKRLPQACNATRKKS
jgi:hypothetical protein